jgi:hypothetical protein
MKKKSKREGGRKINKSLCKENKYQCIVVENMINGLTNMRLVDHKIEKAIFTITMHRVSEMYQRTADAQPLRTIGRFAKAVTICVAEN